MIKLREFNTLVSDLITKWFHSGTIWLEIVTNWFNDVTIWLISRVFHTVGHTSNCQAPTQLPTPSPLHLHFKSIQLLQELSWSYALYLVPYYFSQLEIQVNEHLPLKLKGRELAT